MSNSAPPPQPIRVRSTCDVCLEAKVRCSRDRPACRRCQHHGRDCVYSNKRRLGRPRGTTTKSRAASQSAEAAGTDLNPSTDDTESPLNAAHANGTFGAVPNGLPVESLLSADEQHMAFSDGGHSDSFFPMWLSGLDSDQGISEASSYDHSRPARVDSLFDHDQHRMFGRAYSDFDPGSLGMDTNSLTLVDSTSTVGLASHIGSPLELTEGTDYAFPPSFLSMVDNNILRDVQQRSPPAMSSGYTSIGNSTPITEAPFSSRCLCYNNILQRLSELKDNKSGVSTSGVDHIMKLEKDIRTQILSMMRCDMCLFQRTRALLLVGVVLESVVDLLESVSVAESVMGAGDLPRPALDIRTRSSSSSPSTLYQTPAQSASLQLGKYEICGEERLSFLRQLVRTRLHEVFGLTRQLHEHVQSCRAPASNLRAADTIMAELSHRVRALMNRLEG